MTLKAARIPDHLQAWITARKRYHLSHVAAAAPLVIQACFGSIVCQRARMRADSCKVLTLEFQYSTYFS
jgi:hypothetical protein